ncbi:hypothetical protein ABBQ32_012116 [Trebouxia sp. C0010 RCD-2024]
MVDVVRFRVAQTSDFDVLVQFNRAMAKETEGIDLDIDTLKAGVSNVLRCHGNGSYYVAELQGEVVAALMITYEWSDWRNCQLWWIQSVYVHPDHRRKGFFRQLYKYVRQAAEQAQAGGLRLYADTTNEKAHATVRMLCHH